MDVEPLADIASPSAADIPAPQADIKTRPTPETFKGGSIPTEQPPSPKVRFVDDATPPAKPVSERASVRKGFAAEAPPSTASINQRAAQNVKAKQAAVQRTANIASPQADIKTRPVADSFVGSGTSAMQPPSDNVRFADEAVPSTVSIKQRAAQTVKAKQAAVHETPDFASPQADIKARPVAENFAGSGVPTEQAPLTKVRFTEDAAPDIMPVVERAPVPQVSVAEATPPTASIKQRAAPSVKSAVQTIKTKDAADFLQKFPTAYADNPHAPRPVENVVLSGADTVPTPKLACKPGAEQLVKSKENVFPQSHFGKQPPQPVEAVTHISRSQHPPKLKADMSQSVGAPSQPMQAHGKKRIVKTHQPMKTKVLSHAVKQEGRGIKTTAMTAKKVKQSAKAVQQSRKAVQIARQAAHRAAQTAKIVAKAVVSAIKAFLLAMQTLWAALLAIGGTAFAIITMICLLAIIAGSVMGIFLAAEPTGHGMNLMDAMSQLNEEYYEKISEIEDAVQHDFVEIESSDGVIGIRWEDVLAVYSAKISSGDSPVEVVTLDEEKLNILRPILMDMNQVTYRTRITNKEITVPKYDVNGQILYDKNGIPITETQYIQEVTLIIELKHKTPDEMTDVYAFTAILQKIYTP